jgi:hypothetical protein
VPTYGVPSHRECDKAGGFCWPDLHLFVIRSAVQSLFCRVSQAKRVLPKGFPNHHLHGTLRTAQCMQIASEYCPFAVNCHVISSCCSMSCTWLIIVHRLKNCLTSSVVHILCIPLIQLPSVNACATVAFFLQAKPWSAGASSFGVCPC